MTGRFGSGPAGEKHGMTENEHLRPDELDEQDPELLPEREAMSVLRLPGETPGIVPPDATPEPDPATPDPATTDPEFWEGPPVE